MNPQVQQPESGGGPPTRQAIADLIDLAQQGQADVEIVDTTIRTRYRVARPGEDYPVIYLTTSDNDDGEFDEPYFTDGERDFNLLESETVLIEQVISRQSQAS